MNENTYNYLDNVRFSLHPEFITDQEKLETVTSSTMCEPFWYTTKLTLNFSIIISVMSSTIHVPFQYTTKLTLNSSYNNNDVLHYVGTFLVHDKVDNKYQYYNKGDDVLHDVGTFMVHFKVDYINISIIIIMMSSTMQEPFWYTTKLTLNSGIIISVMSFTIHYTYLSGTHKS